MSLNNAPPLPVNLNPAALDWALKHVSKFGDTIFLPKAFEYEAITANWNDIRTWMVTQDMRSWNPRAHRRFLASKTRYSFRYVTQLDPLENLAFTALVHQVGGQLEAIRRPKVDRVVYSWRFEARPDGQMYDPAYRWSNFTDRCLELAGAPGCHWVVVADIADFFPHIYIHPVERALDTATNGSPEAYCLFRFIRNWNMFVSYGLPVGVAASRILAEATITDVDTTLRGTGRKYCRYSDDIRIFCRSEREAHAALEELAATLFESHGLTLQPAKTTIIPKPEYVQRFVVTPERIEIESLTSKLHDLLEQAGWPDDYEQEIDYDDLPQEIRQEVDALNLAEVFREQLALDRSDPIIMTFLLHRLGQLNLDDVVGDVLNNIERLQHVIDSVVRYLENLRGLTPAQKAKIGKRVLASVAKPTRSSYERVCLLSLFTRGLEFDNEGRFERLHEGVGDPHSQREITLALGRAGKAHWFMRRRRDCGTLEPWLRRAFIAASSCLDADARGPFYRSLRGGSDVLEKAIIKWASANPFA